MNFRINYEKKKKEKVITTINIGGVMYIEFVKNKLKDVIMQEYINSMIIHTANCSHYSTIDLLTVQILKPIILDNTWYLCKILKGAKFNEKYLINNNFLKGVI